MRLEPRGVLLADGGSTKTEWLMVVPGGTDVHIVTQGLNPFVVSEETISAALRSELLPHLGGVQPAAVRFWGAGCAGVGTERMSRVLGQAFAEADVVVDSDLVGAALALCGRSEGVACILGTGANSGVWDGHRIVAHTPPLGYLLGDEGSGASIGRALLRIVMRGQTDDALQHAFWQWCPEQRDALLAAVYGAPHPGRFLASLAPFVHAHRHHPAIHALLLEAFGHFLSRHVVTYGRPDLEVNFVGSIAHYFREELEQAAKASGLRVGVTLRRPLEGIGQRLLRGEAEAAQMLGGL